MDSEHQTKVTETTTQDVPSGTQRTTQVTSASTAPSPMSLVIRLVYLATVILQTLLLFRFLLSLLGANRGNAFADFIFSTSTPFVLPFINLFNFETAYGASRIEVETIVAAIVYAVVATIIIALLRLPRKAAED